MILLQKYAYYKFHNYKQKKKEHDEHKQTHTFSNCIF